MELTIDVCILTALSSGRATGDARFDYKANLAISGRMTGESIIASGTDNPASFDSFR